MTEPSQIPPRSTLLIPLTIGITILCFPALAQQDDRREFCNNITNTSESILMARINGVPESQAQQLITRMTDPRSIRFAREITAFAWSRPPTMGLLAMRQQLITNCLAKTIFAQ
jgi:hypothetical protein